MDNRAFDVSLYPAVAATLITGILSSGCGGGTDGGTNTVDSNSGASAETVSFALDDAARNIQISNGVAFEQVFTADVDPTVLRRGAATLNVNATLSNITISAAPLASNELQNSVASQLKTLGKMTELLFKSATANDTSMGTLTAYVSYSGDPEVCSSPYSFGPYTFMGAIGSTITSDTSAITTTEEVNNIVNSGRFDICFQGTPPIDGFVTVTAVTMDFESCDPPTYDVAGTWNGEYSCTNFGTADDIAEQITLEISMNPDGSYRYTDDDFAVYNGGICGNIFKFNGGLTNSYTESGTLTFLSATTARKSSRWNSLSPGVEGGSCIDNLTKQ